MATIVYKYGMRLRGCAIGTQPKDGFIEREDDPLGDYWDIIVYDRPLTDKELKDYDLDLIGARRKE
jgi:hypothetical protein